MTSFNLGIIGAGRWGPNLIRNFHQIDGCKVVQVSDTSIERLNTLATQYALDFTANPQDIIENPHIDAVVISSPTETHYAYTKMALLAGKHVFVEKPLATTIGACQELIDLASAKQKVLFVGHVFVYNAGIQAVKNMIDSGLLGEIYSVHANRTNLGPIRSDVNALWDLAPHDLSILEYWFNEMPVNVSAVGGRFISRSLDDMAFATYRYANGRLAHIHVSWLHPKKVREIVIVAKNKMLVWDDLDLNHPIRLYDKTVDYNFGAEDIVDSFASFRTSINEGDTLLPRVRLNEPLRAECQAFIATLRSPEMPSLSDGKKGLNVVQALIAADTSMQHQGQPVQIHHTLEETIQYESYIS